MIYDLHFDLLSFLAKHPHHSAYDEQKANGITKEEADYWMREMGLNEKDIRKLLDE